jgi:hypothetical protein
MRDPNRIIPVLNALAQFWIKHPGMRLGQIICSADPYGDPFYVEDDVLMKRIKELECEACEDRQLVEGAECHNCGRKGTLEQEIEPKSHES